MSSLSVFTKEIGQQVYVLRGCQVMLDRDLAIHYQVETKKLKQAVRRNIGRFPDDFMFEPTAAELSSLRSQFVTSSIEYELHEVTTPNLRCQNGTSSSEQKSEHGGNRYTPFAFTELGVAMLSSVLNSERAIQVNISIMRAFVQLRAPSCEEQLRPESAVQLMLLEKRCDALERKLEKLTSHASDLLSPNSSGNSRRVLAIQNAVAQHWGITVEDLKSADRSQSFTLPRHIAIYLVRNQLGLSLNEIGRHFGGRDHATILSALRKIEQLCSINSMIDSITSSIH